ncbi:hypothetical protein HK101_006067, partial [Irineochytrium annulatum]
DALLVAFSPDTGGNDLAQAVLRSLACCLHVATCCKSVDLDMSLAANSQNPDHKRDPLLGEPTSGTSSTSSLYLHFAITAGPMSRVILGDPAYRLDYCVQGPGLRALGTILDNTSRGELGMSADALAELDSARRAEVERLANDKRIGGHTFLGDGAIAALTAVVFGVDAMEMAGMADADVSRLQWGGDFASVNRATRGLERQGTAELQPDAVPDNVDADGEDFIRRFVNHSLLKRIDAHNNRSARGSSSGGRTSGSVDRQFFGVGRRMGSVGQAAPELEFSSVAAVHGVKDAFAEFRSVATIFVAFMIPFEVGIVQRISLSFLRALKEHRADDKGETLLAMFGLPSFSHVNNSDQAVKCMKWFVDDLHRVLDEPFTSYISISISSGEILFTKLGNDFRSELLNMKLMETDFTGDVIITAARLMPISGSKQVIVIDDETHDNVKLTHVTRDLGMVVLKGRVNDSRIHALELGEHVDRRRAVAPQRAQFGYEHEREVLKERFASWHKEGKRAVVIVEAPSGLGKSTLATFLKEHADEHGSEMDQWRPFSGLEQLLLFIFNNLPSPDTLLIASPATKVRRSASGTNSFSTVSRLPSMSSSVDSRRKSSIANASQGGSALGLSARTFLTRAGVDITLAPLLGMVSAGFAVEDTKATKVMDAQAKVNHVKSMVAKIVAAFVKDFGAVFIFDDAQWYDSHTLDVLMVLARYCPKIFLQIMSRPLKLSENRALERAALLPETCHLVLLGFSAREATELIISKLSKLTVRVAGVDPAISAAIYAKTSGSPLFLHMIIDVLFVKVGSDIILNSDGILTIRDESVQVDAILTDLSAAILFQFDRLDATFQRVLKVAYFDMDVAECLELIKDSDVYNFLVCEPSTLTSTQDSRKPAPDGAECFFRHISIMNAIYESLAFEERLAANSSVGTMIESLLDVDNRAALLPSLEYHFSRSGDVDKIVTYKEELGLSLMAKFQCIEGVRILESLVEYVTAANPKDIDKLVIPVTKLRKALWFTRLSSGYSMIRRFPKERDAGLAALDYIGAAPWPKGDRETQLAAKKMERLLFVNWILTVGGRWKPKLSKQTFPQSMPTTGCAASEKTRLIQMEKAALTSLSEAIGMDRAFGVAEKLYLTLRFCNLLMRNNNNPTQWIGALYKLSFHSIFAKPEYYPIFIRWADASDRGRNHPSYIFLKAINKPFSTTYRECIPLLMKFHEIAKSRCDIAFEHLSMGFASAVAFQSGDFRMIDEVAEPFYRASATVKDDPICSFLVTYTLCRVALVRGDVNAIAEWLPTLEPRAAVARRLSFGVGAIESVNAMLAAHMSHMDGALGHLEEYLALFQQQKLGAETIDTVLLVPYLCLLMFDPLRSGLPMPGATTNEIHSPTPWSGANLTRIRTVVKTMKESMKNLGIVHHHVFSFWVAGIYEVMELLIDDRKKQAMSMARKKLKSKRRAELEGMPSYKAMYHGLIAKYSKSEVDRAKSRDISSNLLLELKCLLYITWLEA